MSEKYLKVCDQCGNEWDDQSPGVGRVAVPDLMLSGVRRINGDFCSPECLYANLKEILRQVKTERKEKKIKEKKII